ncbi:MAG: ABC transporter permease [bacterium]
MLAWHLLAPRSQVGAVRDLMADDMRAQEVVAKFYSRLNFSASTTEDADLIIKLRTLTDNSTGRSILLKEPVVALARRDVNRIKTERIAIQGASVPEPEKRARLEQLDVLYRRHVDILTLFNRAGIQTTLRDLSPEQMTILKRYADDIIRQYGTWSKLNDLDIAQDRANGAIRDAMGGRRIAIVMNLDLTWQNRFVGLCGFNPDAFRPWSRDFGVATVRAAGALWAKSGFLTGLDSDPFLDTLTSVGGYPEEYFFPAHDSAGPVFHATSRTPAFSLRNVYADSGLAFTPGDCIERLNITNVTSLTTYLPTLLRAIIDDRDTVSPATLVRPEIRNTDSYTIRLDAFEFDEFSPAVVPQLPVADAILEIIPVKDPKPVMGDVIGIHFAIADSRAKHLFYAVNSKDAASAAFHCDPDFIKVDRAIDAGNIQARVDSNIAKYPVRTLALFSCTEFPIYQKSDSSMVSASPSVPLSIMVLDTVRNGVPPKYAATGISTLSSKVVPPLQGPAAVYIESGYATKLLIGDHRLVLNSSIDNPEGIGFLSPAQMGPDVFAVAARDAAILSRNRMGGMQGVSCDLTSDFMARGSNALTLAAQAASRADHVGYLKALYLALGAETKAYSRVAAITNDMLKAAVFFMILLLPFCFFVQKLLFKFSRIEFEMLAFAAVFAGAFMVFKFVHPAFRIAKAPGAILIAFIMLALALFVIRILNKRFEGEMRLLFRRHSSMDTAAIGYSTVGQNAMLVGVHNMKNRRIRTTLTTGTIVLITFAMLAFSSISQKLNPTIVSVTRAPRYTGLFYSWPGNLRMDEASLQVFRDLLHGEGQITVRRWLLPQSFGLSTLSMHGATGTGSSMDVQAILGLQAAEDGFIARMPLTHGRFFSSDDAMEVVLPASAATVLKINSDNMKSADFVCLGQRFTVVGIVDDDRFRAMKDLNEWPILPIKNMRQSFMDRPSTGLDAATPEESGVFFVETSGLVIMPVETARRLGAEPYSISVRLKDDAPMWPLVDKILTATDAKFHVSSRIPLVIGSEGKRTNPPGSYFLGSGYRTSIGGLAVLIVPLLIAATIILNTMLGSVHERKPEIAIYNAIGLNPTHITIFFLSEALVYGIIGSVGGYLVGQVLSIGLTRFGVIPGINLNFSSVTVVYVVAFTIAVVLLSTLFPAMVAARIAVPSGKRKWAMPVPEGDRMSAVLPFTCQPDMICGIMAYLDEYFGHFSEAAIGEMTAKLSDGLRASGSGKHKTYSLVFDVTLAPFDLGVTQRVTFVAAHEPAMNSYRIKMTIDRISGQDTAWIATNKPFMDRLRMYLMHWRNLDTSRHAFYGSRATAIIGTDSA